MAEARVVDIHILHFKPSSISVHPEINPPPALETATSLLQAVSGVDALHLGRKIEDENSTTWVLVTTWTSHDDANAFVASESWMPFRAALRSAVDGGEKGNEGWETRRSEFLAPDGVDSKQELSERVLGAPCTEIFTTFGGTEEYWMSARVFNGIVVKAGEAGVPGFKGAVCGRAERGGRASGEPEGETVTLMLGWESMEAHYKTKEKPGVLLDSIQEHLRGGWTSFAMCHVNFKKLRP